ncbi:MAG TPA: NAD(P)-binding domain-containing protein [Chthoniobacterales bacterium]|nr:NAD(P)-binding domain-containing protein [Chthoniobacterales bacterium]
MSRRTQRNVGVIGLGIIGQRVAENLRRRGFSVFVWNRTPRPFPNFVGSPVELAQLCDYIQIFVSDDEALLEMVQQLKQSLKAHHIVLAHSTVAPHTMRAAAEIAHRRGAQFLDAPFTGSKTAAEKGELVYYIGGDEAAFKRARPVLEASSKEIIEIGEIGQATTVKIATNMVTAATVQVAAEALALVHNSGLAPDKLVAALRGNAINSPTLNLKLPKMIEGDFDPHFSVKHMLKDVQIASRLARSYDLTLGATEAARDSLLAEVREGRGDDDFSSLVHIFFPEGPAAEATEEAAESAQHPTLDLEGATAKAIESGTEPEAREERAMEVVSSDTADEDEKILIASEVTKDLPETADRGEDEKENAAALEASKPEATSESESAEPHDEVPTASSEEIETVVPEKVETEPEPIAVAVQDAAEPEEKRGFFSRMFGKGLDY